MNDKLLKELKQIIKGDVSTDEKTLAEYSHDASLFEVKPQVIVYPRDEKDVQSLVKFVAENKKENPNLSLTARSAGTDMSGGPLNESIIVSFTKYLNKFKGVHGNTATAEPGLYYRDFEKETLKHGLLLASYPASREICAMGGIINNNAGGEKSLQYGKTERFVKRVRVVLSNGEICEFKPLTEAELKAKMELKTFEGEIYKKMFELITNNLSLILDAKPRVSKNSAGYYLWNVYDKEKGIFDLTRLFVGAQGTLGMMTEATLQLIPVKKYSEMIIVFLHSLTKLGEIIHKVSKLEPESFESYDNNTLKLAIKYFYEFGKQLKTKNILQLAWDFAPEFWLLLKGGMPKLILQIEFEGDERKIIDEKIENLRKVFGQYQLDIKIAPSKRAERKYWTIRRESFNLLRNKVKDKHAAPFIDDFVVKPEFLSEFLPKLYKIFEKYPHLIYTIAGHMGDGNFHIIPLMNLGKKADLEIIPKLADEVYDLVISYHGSITGEHNDGLIRTPYLPKMYSKEVIELFEEVKKIFDPQNIFNPRKKVNGDLDYSMSHIRTSW